GFAFRASLRSSSRRGSPASGRGFERRSSGLPCAPDFSPGFAGEDGTLLGRPRAKGQDRPPMTEPWPLVFSLTLAACGAAAPSLQASRVGVVTSNVARADYVGSSACASCHRAEAEAWQRSPMRSMTRLARDVPIEPVFDGRRFEYKGDRVTLFAA